jgi:hypothetical protein
MDARGRPQSMAWNQGFADGSAAFCFVKSAGNFEGLQEMHAGAPLPIDFLDARSLATSVQF